MANFLSVTPCLVAELSDDASYTGTGTDTGVG